MNIAAQRFVFNLYRGQFMPVAEIARRHGKGRLAGHSGKIDIALTATLDAARDLNLASLATSEYQSLDLKKKDLAWQSVKGSGTQDETTRYTRLNAGQLQISAGNRISADMSVKASAQKLANEPGMDWLKQIQEDPRLNSQIDWNRIEEAHQKWDYDQQGLTPAAAVVVAIVVAYFTAGAGAEAVAGMTGTTATTTATAAQVAAAQYATATVMTQAAITTLASQASVSLINNQGDIGATLHELGSQENLRQLAIAMVTAGALKGIGDTFTIDGKALNTISVKDGFAANAGKNLINGLARATLTSAVTGTDLETSLRTEAIASILNAASAQGANWIGDQAQTGQINEFGRAFAHAVAGCMAGAAGASAPGSNTSAGSGCGAGALGAVVGELSAKLYGSENPAKTIAFSSMMSGIAAALTGQDAQGVVIASSTGANAAENNRLLHVSEMQRIKDLAKGDPQKEAQLTAAACAMVHCADGVPKDDPSYAYLKALQDAGANLTDEKTLLSQQKSREGRSNGSLFQYSGVDQYLIDPFTQNKAGTRLLGAGQAGLGLVGSAGSAALCTTGIGCAAGAITGTVSADYAWAGAKQAVTGNAQTPYGEQVLQSLGMSPQAAAYTYAALGIAPATVELVAVNRAVNAQAAANATAKLSYEPIEKFGVQGIQVTPAIMQTPQARAIVAEYQTAGYSAQDAERFAKNLISSGSDLPTYSTVAQGTELIKVVPKTASGGDSVSAFTPFFMTRQEFNALSRLPTDQIAQRLGLPAEQGVRGSQLGFDVYTITPKPGTVPNVFASEVAPVVQGSYTASGGAKQILVPNRSEWTTPVKIGTVGGTR